MKPGPEQSPGAQKERSALRALIVAMLTGFIAAVYLLVAALERVTTGRVEFGTGSSVLATGLVALGFAPARKVAARVSARLLHGRRGTPYDLLDRVSEITRSGEPGERMLVRMAEAIGYGVGAASAQVWVRVASTLAQGGAWPQANPNGGSSLRLPADDTLPFPPEQRAFAVRHAGELLGAITVTPRPGRALSPADDALLADLASQASIALRNVRLTAELSARLQQATAQAAELDASRRRLVATQDAARRALERNIHDGAQQYLVALAVKSRLAATKIAKGETVAPAVSEVRTLAADALLNLRALSQGIYPDALTKRGLIAALRTIPQATGMRVEIRGPRTKRFPPEIEAAAYFVCVEAIQNAERHAGALTLTVAIACSRDRLSLRIADDGKGFDPAAVARTGGMRNMQDRVAVVEGTFALTSSSAGTAIDVEIPLSAQDGRE